MLENKKKEKGKTKKTAPFLIVKKILLIKLIIYL